jgi:hypothetical protein
MLVAKTKSKTSAKARPKSQEPDSIYLLKLVLYVIVGMQWLRLAHGSSVVPIPVGLIIGLLFASHDHFRIDRKIEFALLLVAALVGLWLHSGVFMSY